MKPIPLNPTARDLLVYVAGDEHALHFVKSWRKKGTSLGISCSCGSVFAVAFSEAAKRALRNVPEGLVS